MYINYGFNYEFTMYVDEWIAFHNHPDTFEAMFRLQIQ